VPETDAQRVARRRAELANALAPMAASLARRDLGRLGARVRHRVTFPSTGQMTVRWFVPAATARRYGVRLRSGASRLLVAEGRGRGVALQSGTIDVAATGRGRTILRRARAVTLTVTAGLGGVAASATVTLRRHR
jgi:hypothetical protein